MPIGGDRTKHTGSTRRKGFRLNHVRDPRTARRWFTFDVAFVIVALGLIVFAWTGMGDNTVGAVLLTVVSLVTIANVAWEMSRLWPVTGWRRRAGEASDPTDLRPR